MPFGPHIAETTGTTWRDSTVQEAVRYTYAVVAFDAADNRSARSALRSETAGAASTAPTSLTVVLVNRQPLLSWGAATDNVGVVGYVIYRSIGGGLGPEIVRTPNLNWVDTTAVIGTKYTYAVKAYDAAGYLSDRSNFATVTVK